MGANVYLVTPASYGYKQTHTSDAIIAQFIPRRAGERISIRGFGLSAGSGATSVYFATEIGKGTTSKAILSNATTTFALDAAISTTNPLASNDYIAIELDDASYQGVMVASGSWSDFAIAEALQDTVSTGNNVYHFGSTTDDNVIRFVCAVSVQTTDELDGGIFYANAMGKAMLVHHENDSSPNGWGSIDYLTVDYLNV